jgi:glycyl-tRNA synthetase
MQKYEEIINLALRRSLFFPASEIYQNYPAGFFDFGPYGAVIKRKIIQKWRRELIQNEDFLEIEGSVFMPSEVFKASGHLEKFNDPITICKKCKTTYRIDKLLTEQTGKEFTEAMPLNELTEEMKKNKITCTKKKCSGELTDAESSNLMIKAIIGTSQNTQNIFLRPETCQSIFLDFSRLYKTMRIKLPKGIAQVGAAYRNEISPRQTLMRSIEFTQMETEIFFNPEKINEIEKWEEIENYEIMIQKKNEEKATARKAKDLVKNKIVSGKIIAYFLARTQQLYEKYGIKKEHMRFRELDDKERAFYSKESFDFEIETSTGWTELIANNYRTDHDLKSHMQESKEDIRAEDETGKKFIPHVWEISIGTNRTLYTILEHAYKKEGERTYLSLQPEIAPFHAGIFPLLSNKKELVEKAKKIYHDLKNCFELTFDKTGSIGKRYARVDEIGVPICITIDFDTIKDNTVTVRDRDTCEQKRIKTEKLREFLFKIITGTEFKKA